MRVAVAVAPLRRKPIGPTPGEQQPGQLSGASLQNTDYDQGPIEQALRQGEGDAYRSSPWACREVCRKAGCRKSAPRRVIMSFIVCLEAPMTDAELEGRLLSHFYNLRHRNGGIVPVTEEILSGGEPISREAIAGVCRELGDVGLIEWTPYLPGHVIGSARIRGPGVDAVERGSSASLRFDFRIRACLRWVTLKVNLMRRRRCK